MPSRSDPNLRLSMTGASTFNFLAQQGQAQCFVRLCACLLNVTVHA